MANSKMRAEFERYAREQDTHIEAARMIQLKAMDQGHPDNLSACKYLLDQLIGKAGQSMEIQSAQSMSLAFTPEVASMLGVQSLKARVVDEDGSAEDIEIGDDGA